MIDKALQSIQRSHDHISHFKKKLGNIEGLYRHHKALARQDQQSLPLSTGAVSSLAQHVVASQLTSLKAASGVHQLSVDNGRRDEAVLMPEAGLPGVTSPRSIPTTPHARHRSCRNGSSIEFVESQETKLSQIIESMHKERPTAIRRKLKLFNSLEPLSEGGEERRRKQLSGNAADLLNEVRQVAEQERVDRRNRNRRQGKVYLGLLDRLHVRQKPPSPAELSFIEIIRRVLEAGGVVGQESALMIRQVLGNQAAQIEEMLEVIVKAGS